MKRMSEEAKGLIKDACKRMTGAKKRSWQAGIAMEYFDGSACKAEREMGWGRESVTKGLKEARSGIRCADNYRGRGRKRTEERIPGVRENIISVAEPRTQTDPAMKSSRTYTRLTGKALRKILINEKGYKDEDLPSENTLGNMLNRMGYNLKRVLKSKPAKKIKEVDEIFENVRKANRESDENPESQRISIDSKAKVKIGEFSRNGKSRDREAKKAGDHDMNPEMKLVPHGILDVLTGILSIFFGTSFETSDFIVDCIEM
ncbi:MAG: hypothetical protein GY765_07775 [bacterium]|nr:hypothetical protein [bacterium]